MSTEDLAQNIQARVRKQSLGDASMLAILVFMGLMAIGSGASLLAVPLPNPNSPVFRLVSWIPNWIQVEGTSLVTAGIAMLLARVTGWYRVGAIAAYSVAMWFLLYLGGIAFIAAAGQASWLSLSGGTSVFLVYVTLGVYLLGKLDE